MFKKVLILYFMFLLVGCGSISKISCSKKDDILLQDNSILVVVRTSSEYQEGHLKDAINIPYDEIVKGISKVRGVNLETHIIVYCKSGGRSSKAFKALKNAGYINVYDLGAMSKCS